MNRAATDGAATDTGAMNRAATDGAATDTGAMNRAATDGAATDGAAAEAERGQRAESSSAMERRTSRTSW